MIIYGIEDKKTCFIGMRYRVPLLRAKIAPHQMLYFFEKMRVFNRIIIKMIACVYHCDKRKGIEKMI